MLTQTLLTEHADIVEGDGPVCRETGGTPEHDGASKEGKVVKEKENVTAMERKGEKDN